MPSAKWNSKNVKCINFTIEREKGRISFVVSCIPLWWFYISKSIDRKHFVVATRRLVHLKEKKNALFLVPNHIYLPKLKVNDKQMLKNLSAWQSSRISFVLIKTINKYNSIWKNWCSHMYAYLFCLHSDSSKHERTFAIKIIATRNAIKRIKLVNSYIKKRTVIKYHIDYFDLSTFTFCFVWCLLCFALRHLWIHMSRWHKWIFDENE